MGKAHFTVIRYVRTLLKYPLFLPETYEETMAIDVYTDGCCLGNPGPGGYGIVIFLGGERREFSGGEKHTTNNKMEMTAAIVALEKFNAHGHEINLYTDSKYLIEGITKWIRGWKKNGWKTASKQPVKNGDLWIKLDMLNSRMKINWIWVKGHADNEWNNRCDLLAKEAAGRQ